MRDIAILSIMPLLLIMCASIVAYRYDMIVMPQDNVAQEKYSKLIAGIKSGDISPCKEDIVSYFENAKNLDKHQSEYNSLMSKVIGSLIEAVIITGLLQILLVYLYIKKKANAAAQNTI